MYLYIYFRGPKAKLCHPLPTKDILYITNAGHGHCWCFVGLTHFFSSLFDLCIWHIWEPMEENQNHVENMWTRPDLFFKVFSTSTQIRGYFGGACVTAKFGRSTAKFGRSMAKFSLTTVASRSRHAPLFFPFVFFIMSFHGRFPVVIHFICWGWLRQP
jgi:hypothetical protein